MKMMFMVCKWPTPFDNNQPTTAAHHNYLDTAVPAITEFINVSVTNSTTWHTIS
jgi:hypothetical protein